MRPLMPPLIGAPVGAPMTDVRWLTYRELADVLGIGAASAANLARRKHWTRQPGNDGRTRVGLPADYVPSNGGTDAPMRTPSDAATDGPIEAATCAPSYGRNDAGVIQALN